MENNEDVCVMAVELEQYLKQWQRNLASKQMLHEVYRQVHNLKGYVGGLGKPIGVVTLLHDTESVLCKLEEDTLTAAPDLLDFLSALCAELQKVYSGENFDLEPLILELSRQSMHYGQSDNCKVEDIPVHYYLRDQDKEILKKALSAGEVWGISCRLNSDYPMKMARMLLLLQAMRSSSGFIASLPDESDLLKLESPEEITCFGTNPNMLKNACSAFKDFIEPKCKQLTQDNLIELIKIGTDIQKVQVKEKDRGHSPLRHSGTYHVEGFRIERMEEIISLIRKTIQTQDVEQNALLSELEYEMEKVKFIPLAYLVTDLPRMARNLATKLGKEVDFFIKGADIRLTRQIGERVKDILLPMLNNAVDHGVELPDNRRKLGKPEKGNIEFNVCINDRELIFTFSDDGKGISEDIQEKIFLPGFTTAGKISETSGRGIGLDIVKGYVEKLSGSITVKSKVNAGTSFTVVIPLSETAQLELSEMEVSALKEIINIGASHAVNTLSDLLQEEVTISVTNYENEFNVLHLPSNTKVLSIRLNNEVRGILSLVLISYSDRFLVTSQVHKMGMDDVSENLKKEILLSIARDVLTAYLIAINEIGNFSFKPVVELHIPEEIHYNHIFRTGFSSSVLKGFLFLSLSEKSVLRFLEGMAQYGHSEFPA